MMDTKLYPKTRMAAPTNDIASIAKIGLKIWLPGYNWESEVLEGWGNIDEDISELYDSYIDYDHERSSPIADPTAKCVFSTFET